MAAQATTVVALRGASAQTDYYNLDAGRPLRVEDALVIERHALEWQMAPLRVSGSPGRRPMVAVEPELAWGAWPRTQVEVGLPLSAPEGDLARGGLGGVDVSFLYALNAETLTWPALALSVGTLIPAGPYAPAKAWTEFRAIATRTLTQGRVHVNAAVTPGRVSGRVSDEQSRWRLGVAGDRTFAVRSLLVGAEVVAEEPLGSREVEWSAGMGMRYQVGPRAAVDVGIGRGLRAAGDWYVTMGSAVSFGLLHRFGGVR